MRIKYLLKSLTPLFIILIVFIITYFAAFAISVFIGDVKVSDANTALVNEGIYNLLRFSTSLIIFTWWFLKIASDKSMSENPSSGYKTTEETAIEVLKGAGRSFKDMLKPVRLISLILLGFSIQVTTDSIIYILSSAFSDSFSSYTKMMESFKGSESVLFIITVTTLAPLVEELVFRGIMMHYAIKIMPDNSRSRLPVAIIIQALFFGIYHGNLIQFFYAFIFAILFAVIDSKFNSLVPSILLHIIVNASLYVISRKIFVNVPFSVLIFIISLAVLIITFIVLYRSHTASDD